MIQDNAAFLRAIKGPVMMITVGVLFALDNFTPLSFSRTWPLLLVVAGLLSFGRRSCGKNPVRGKYQYRAQWGPPRPPTPPPPPPPPSPSTAGPGSYRGSTYEGTPGAPPRPAQPKNSESKETRSSDLGATQ
jgi:hypothetical protein